MPEGRIIPLIRQGDLSRETEVIGEIRVDNFGKISGMVTDPEMTDKLSDERYFSYFKLEG